jgi:hypothetical protein
MRTRGDTKSDLCAHTADSGIKITKSEQENKHVPLINPTISRERNERICISKNEMESERFFCFHFRFM